MSSVPRVAGIVLASGMSRRFGAGNKLLAVLDGLPVVRCTTEPYLQAGLDPVLVVVGHEADRVQAALAGLGVRFVDNPLYREGQSQGLVCGVRALAVSVDAAVIGVADQPYLSACVIDALVDTWRSQRAPVVAPRYGGQRGNPVLFDRRLFPELLEVTGDRGGRAVVERYGEEAVFVDVEDVRQGADIDTLEDLERLA